MISTYIVTYFSRSQGQCQHSLFNEGLRMYLGHPCISNAFWDTPETSRNSVTLT